MSVVYLDTHVAVWLHDGLVEKLSKSAKAAIEESHLLISPMVYLEFEYMRRRRRVRNTPAELYANLNTSFAVTLCNQPFAAVAAAAAGIDWTEDPFDRIIAAQSMANPRSRLITADETIRARFDRALW